MQKTFALFDFDGTLIRGDSIILFMRYARQNRLCSAFDLFRFLVAGGLFAFRLLSPLRAKELALRFLKGRKRAEYTKAAKAFCKNVLLPRLYPQAAEELRRHQEAGHTVLLISASPAFYLEPLKELLGFAEVLGTQFETDDEGRFTGKIIGINCRGEEKPLRFAQYLKETGAQIDYNSSSAYGDSAHDLPMLGLCRNAYAVNPNPRMRRKLKTMGGITVIRWKETR